MFLLIYGQRNTLVKQTFTSLSYVNKAVKYRFAKVVGVEKRGMLGNMKRALMGKFSFSQFSPYGNGDAAMKIINVVMKETR